MPPAKLASPSASTPQRGRRRAMAAAVVGLLALSACTSDPGARRVAIDIVQAEAENNPDLDSECLTEAVKEFSDDELTAISTNAEATEEGAEILADFRAALAACS